MIFFYIYNLLFMSCCKKLKQFAATDQIIDWPKYLKKSVIKKNEFIEEKQNMTISGEKKRTTSKVRNREKNIWSVKVKVKTHVIEKQQQKKHTKTILFFSRSFEVLC